MTDEEFVRANWVEVYNDGYSVRLILPEALWIEAPKFSGALSRWSAAAAFTTERLEEIRQLREEIALVADWKDGTLGMGRESTIERCRWARILIRLETTLADLKRGMREQEGSGA